MPSHNPENERIKRAYLVYLKEARRLSEHSVDAAAAALARFEAYTRFRDFRRFHFEQAIGFKRRLAEEKNMRTGEQLSKATVLATLNTLRVFLQWLSQQPGYRSRIQYADADYFTLSDKDARIASVGHERPVPTLEQLQHVIAQMPSGTEIELRDRAVVAFTLLTGARDGATASFKLKHIDLEVGKVAQDAREVRTKFSKTFTTWFFPVGEEIFTIVQEWVHVLKMEKLFGPQDPLFPATAVGQDPEMRFAASGLSRAHWSNATPIRKIFRQAFARVGLPYANPHSARKTLAQLGERLCRTPEEFKAWSQNLGHDGVMTTFNSYGQVAANRQAELIKDLGRRSTTDTSETELGVRIAEIVREMDRRRG